MLTSYDIKRILDPKKTVNPSDDFRMIDSWAEYEESKNGDVNKRPLDYLCYQLEIIDPENGQKKKFFKAIKFARVIRLPKSAKQSTSLMDTQGDVLAAVYESGINLITIIANVIHPEPLGLLYLYGVQGVGNTIEEAKAKAHDGFLGFVYSMQGSFPVLEMRKVNAEETEWLREKMYGMKYITVVRGIPKANDAGVDVGNKGMGGRNLNPDSQGTLEEIILGMADYEYVIQVLSTPVYRTTLEEWSRRTQRDMTDWYAQLQGTKSFSFNLSIPMMFSNNQSNSQGWNKGYTNAESASYSHGENFSSSYGENVGQALSNSFSQSHGQTQGQSITDTVSQSHTVSQGSSFGQTVGRTFGTTVGQTFGTTTGQTAGNTFGATNGTTSGLTQGLSQGQSINHSDGVGTSHGQGVSQGASYNYGQGQSASSSHSISQNQGLSLTNSQTSGITNSASVGQSASSSINQSQSTSVSNGETIGTTTSNSHSGGTTHTTGGSVSEGVNISASHGWNTGENSGNGLQVFVSFNNGNSSGTNGSNSSGTNNGTSDSNTDSLSSTNTTGTSNSHSASSTTTNGASVSSGSSLSNSITRGESMSLSHGLSQGQTWGAGESWGATNGVSANQSWGANQGTSENISVSQNASNGWGQSASLSNSASLSQSGSLSASQSNSLSASQSQSASLSNSQSTSASQSYTQNVSESMGISRGQSVGQSYSESATESVSKGLTNSYGQSQSVSQGQSYSNGTGVSNSQSLGSSGAYVSGTAASMGVGPSIGYNKSYQWLDQQVQDILEILQFQNERLKTALRIPGAFYTYVYIACPSQDALSTAMTVAKSTWHNELAMMYPLQVLNLSQEEQGHLLYHFSAFSSDVTKENISGTMDYKYATVLLPNEYVAYTHLPRVSEGGIFAEVNDIPKFSVPSMMKGEIFMGTILSPERYTFENGYRTQHDYRIDEGELMHGFFTGASRSGKTVAAMRFIAELSHIKRKKTGKRMRIVCMDPKQDWRTLARFVEPERFRFYNMGNASFRPIKINPLKIPHGVKPQFWIDGVIDIFCRAYGLLERGKQMMGETIYSLYEEAGVFEAEQYADWKERIPELSKEVTFTKVYERMTSIKVKLEDPSNPKGRAGNDTRDAYARLLDRLQAFSRPYSIEHKLFGTSEGMGVDEMIGDDDVTVLESKGLENTFKNFIFGVITSGFYKYAIAHEGGFLAEDQYETVLVIEEANEVLVGNDCAGTGGGQQFGMTGQSEFEQILDQSAGYGLFIMAITQKIADMPKSIIANSGLIFAGRLKTPDDITVVVRAVAREDRFEDRDLVKWFPRQPTGWFVCQSSRTFDFKDAEPILVNIARLNIAPPSNAEIDEMLISHDVIKKLKKAKKAKTA